MESKSKVQIKANQWCNTRVELTKCSFQWIIENFSLYDMEKSGFSLKSSTFNSDENDKIKWHLKMYPKGEFNDFKDYVSLFLCLNSKENNVKTNVELSLLNDWGVKKEITTFNDTFNEYHANAIGYPKFVKRDYLFSARNGLLKNDQLIVYCEVTVYGNSVTINGVNNSIQYNHECQMSDDFRNLFQSKEFSDVIIDVNGLEYSAHRVVLSARSPVFEAMFKSDMKENIQNRIEINDMSGDVIYEMLRYIYTGKVMKLKQMAYDLFIAADKYDLKQLKIMCEDSVRAHLCIETAADALILSDMHSARELKEFVIPYVRRNIFEIGKTKGWERMVHEYPKLAASLFFDEK